MKKIILLAAMALISSNAMAEMHNSKSMTCSTIRDRVKQEGKMALQYPSSHPGLMMYNRYVSNSMSCLGQGSMASVTVPTSDDPKCKMRTCVFITGKGSNKNH
ncbi:MAG: hypothetical protein KGI75_19695 [Rhizobiaceae bacterium]|nr:hypothetical protein [Rhizobiaceae bacterium]